MNETINITKDTEDAKFEDFVKQSENSLIYQSKNYLDLVADYLKSEKGYIYALRENKIISILPFLSTNGPLGKVYNSLAFFGGNGGVIQNEINDKLKKSMINFFFNFAKNNSACSATIITNPLNQDHFVYDSNKLHDFKTKRRG